MGTSTLAAYDPADAKMQTGVLVFNRAVVVTMDGQTGGVPAGTDQLMEL